MKRYNGKKLTFTITVEIEDERGWTDDDIDALTQDLTDEVEDFADHLRAQYNTFPTPGGRQKVNIKT